MSAIELRPAFDVIERWMRQWPGVPVVIAVRIDPVTGVKGVVEGKHFMLPDTTTDFAAMLKWIGDRQGGIFGWANIYFHPNALRGPIDKKAGVVDVLAMQTLHVDKDVPAGGDQELEIKKIVELLKKLRDKDGNVAQPSDIIISGGGAQAYWRLASPVPINGDLAIADDLKLYNKYIELELTGDHCHSLDHIMRMPGTVNIPDVKKRAMGRVPRLATWEFHDEGKRYSLLQFSKAPPEDKAATARANAKDGDLNWSHETIPPNDERIRGLSEDWKRIGIEGDTKNEYLDIGGKTDRSNMAFAFVTACMRCSPPVADDVIKSILMDKGWKVGECIRDKGATVKRHVNRIIERAHKFVAEDVTKPPIINTDKWDEVADKFLQRCFPDGLVYWRDEPYPYRNGVYPLSDESFIEAKIYEWLCTAEEAVAVRLKDDKGKPSKDDGGQPKIEWETKPFHPTKKDCGELLYAVQKKCYISSDWEQPCWLRDAESYPPAHECINLLNGKLHVPTRALLDHTPDYFSSSISDFAYDKNATCPVWQATLEQYWPDAGAREPEQLQEMFGYSMTPWTALQKLFALLGPGRSGKGTITRVLTALVGAKNIAAPTLRSLGTDFGRHALINKLIAIIGEAVFGAKDDKAEITNFLKTVSGEDNVSIPRKYLSDWQGRLLVRIWLCCNKITDFEDSGKALMMRIVPLRMTRSFADNPDYKLGDKLEAEIAGIFNWALEGYDRLQRAGGEFTMAVASTETKELFGRLASPLMTFLEDYCKLDPKHSASRDDLYLAYHDWCDKVSLRPKSMGKAIEDIISLEPSKLKLVRKGTDNDRFWAITGLSLTQAPPPRRDNRRGQGRDEGRHAGAETASTSTQRGETDPIPF